MKKLSDYKGQKIAVNCTTPEQAEAFCKLMHENGLKWSSGFSYLTDTYWNEKKENTCYAIDENTYNSMCFFKSDGYTILPASDFLEEVLEEEFVYGQEYEFSDNENFKYKEKSKFISKLPDGYFVSFYEENGAVKTWKYCRKINTERNKAITTIKELITKFDIKQEEIY